MPELTVLMPVFNSEKYLADAIDSMLAQTFADFEFLILDDGSTDNSVAIIQSYQDTRIRFYRNEKNMGITPTLNKGIELATTDYIARMDADDISYPDRLQKQFTYLKAHPDCALVSALVRVISEDGQFIRQDRFKSELFYYNLTFSCWIYHPTVMYRKQAVEKVKRYSTAYAEDYELFWQLSRHFKLYNLPEVLLDYRVTDQSLHQVLKKQEYEIAEQEQVLRNIRYYTSSDFSIPSDYIECYRFNFQPLLSEQKVSRIVACVKALDFINQAILPKENVNRDVRAIKKAAQYKRRYILAFFFKNIPPHQKVLLFTRTFSIEDFAERIKSLLKDLIVK
jgi:glycosyltransferase involved in cell wall biosynthesis